jgi:shikimate dehydrogenase
MHESEGRAHGLDYEYRLLDLDLLEDGNDLAQLLSRCEREGFSGLNITHPCKQAVLAHLTGVSDEVAALEAANTVLLREGERIGHNTDWSGFAQSLRRGLPHAAMQEVVQLGAGGAGAATAFAALTLGTGHLVIFDINHQRAQQLAERLNAHFGAARAEAGEDIEAAMAAAQGLIHATPTGMDRHPGLPLAAELLRPAIWVAEVVYFPLETELLRAARAAGCRTLDGGGMAVFQAAEAFRLFTGMTPDTERMLQHFESMR